MALNTDNATYWLVAVPNWAASGRSAAFAKKSEQQLSDDEKMTRRALRSTVEKLADVYDFPVPPLRVGTLDTLMTLSDELVKHDTVVENVMKKLEKAYREMKQDPTLEMSVGNVPVSRYIEEFQWDLAKYTPQAPLKSLTEMIVGAVSSADEETRKRQSRYADILAQISAQERKESGSLLVRPLQPFIKASDIVEGEFLSTLLVVVPKNRAQEWETTYETVEQMAKEEEQKRAKEAGIKEGEGKKQAVADEEEANVNSDNFDPNVVLSEEAKQIEADRELRRQKARSATSNVVPRSSKKLAEDEEFVLYRVIVLKKGRGVFKAMCRERRWTVRSFTFEPELAADDNKDIKANLVHEKNKLQGSLLRWYETAFAEVFSAWMHVKCVRCFVESVLRYGIPVNYQACLLKPRKNMRTKLRKSLADLYARLGSTDMSGGAEDKAMDMGGNMEFYPYVYLTIDMEEK